MAEKSQKEKSHLYPTVIAAFAACSIMLFRVLGIVMIFNPLLLGTLFAPLFVMMITSGLLLWWVF